MFGEIYDIDRYIERARSKEHCGAYEQEQDYYLVDLTFYSANEAIIGDEQETFKTLEEAKAFLKEQSENGFSRYADLHPSASEVGYSILSRDSYAFCDVLDDGVISLNKYPFLSQCKDFSLLAESLEQSDLEYIEKSIAEYESLSDDEYREMYEDYPTVIQWYEGLVDTRDLIDVLNG